jgi:uncharacterized repeat protein (TIGR01451 family)
LHIFITFQEKNMDRLTLKRLINPVLILACCILIIFCSKKAYAGTDVTVSDSSLPPVSGHWTQSPVDSLAIYAGTMDVYGKTLEGEIRIKKITLRNFHNIQRTTDSGDEILEFDGIVEGTVTYMRFAMGIHTNIENGTYTLTDMTHAKIRVIGKAGKTTGTYPLKLESLLITLGARDLEGNKIDAAYIRNVSGMNSAGSITINDIGSGKYQVSGYLDAYTEGAMKEISSNTYFPDQNGPVHLLLQSFPDSNADLSVTQSASSPVYAGGNLTYTITVNKTGYDDADEVILTDALPAGATFISASAFSSHGEQECTLSGSNLACFLGDLWSTESATVKVTVLVPSTTSLTNAVRLTSMAPEQNLSNNISTLVTTVENTSSSADVSVSQIASPDPGVKDNSLYYTVTVTNNGPTAANTVLTDFIPDNSEFISMATGQGSCSQDDTIVTCSLGSINSGNSVVVQVHVKPDEPCVLTNKAIATSSTPDPVRANNSSELTTKVSPTDLVLTQSTNIDSVKVGNDLIYTFHITNNGPEPIEELNLLDTIPYTVNIVSLTPEDTCDWGPEIIGCYFTDMASGASKTVTLTVTPTLAGVLTNKVDLKSSTPNINSANSSSIINTTVKAAFIDSDSDTMDDDWETSYFGNLSRNGTVDYDNDQLTDLAEYQEGTNPTVKDTDSDGMPDGWEVLYNLDPLTNDASADQDNDGFNNLKEYLKGTNPTDKASHPPKSMPWLPILLE